MSATTVTTVPPTAPRATTRRAAPARRDLGAMTTSSPSCARPAGPASPRGPHPRAPTTTRSPRARGRARARHPRGPALQFQTNWHFRAGSGAFPVTQFMIGQGRRRAARAATRRWCRRSRCPSTATATTSTCPARTRRTSSTSCPRASKNSPDDQPLRGPGWSRRRLQRDDAPIMRRRAPAPQRRRAGRGHQVLARPVHPRTCPGRPRPSSSSLRPADRRSPHTLSRVS